MKNLFIKFNAINDRIARRLSPVILSMAIFYVLTIGFVVGLADPRFLVYFQAFSSNWYQGIALPIIGVSGAIAAAETMKLIRETHDAVMEMHEQHAADLAALHMKHDELHNHVKGTMDVVSANTGSVD